MYTFVKDSNILLTQISVQDFKFDIVDVKVDFLLAFGLNKHTVLLKVS